MHSRFLYYCRHFVVTNAGKLFKKLLEILEKSWNFVGLVL